MWSLRLRQPRPAFIGRSRCGYSAKPFKPAQSVINRAAISEALASSELQGTTYDALWDAFASKVQGEWEGVTVMFNADGDAQPLPESFVPGAYREWGVELYDWQSQSSCLATQGPGNERSLRNIFKRLMPTVGCEADAIAYVEEAKDVWEKDGGSLIKPVTPTGSYVAAPAKLVGKSKVEVCLAAPDGQSRLRATLTLMQHWESKQWHVSFVDLSRETYDGPFNGGVELSGCAGGGKRFAKEPVTTLEQLFGDWSAKEVYRYMRSNNDDGVGSLEFQAGAYEGNGASLAGVESSTAIFLPSGAWISYSAAGSNVNLLVGALRNTAERDVAVCRFVEGNIAEVVLAAEVKQA